MSVSIPFKREGTGEPFPLRLGYVTLMDGVSIPFKREGTCEQTPMRLS